MNPSVGTVFNMTLATSFLNISHVFGLLQNKESQENVLQGVGKQEISLDFMAGQKTEKQIFFKKFLEDPFSDFREGKFYQV
jgi:hypothetical protein